MSKEETLESLSHAFRPFRAATAGQNTEAQKAPPSETPQWSGEFSVARELWQQVQKDPSTKVSFEQYVADYLERMLAPEKEKQTAAGFARGYQDGHSEGLRRGIEDCKAAAQRLEEIATRVLEEKRALLHDHESHWLWALKGLLERLLSPLRPEVLPLVQAWIRREMADWEEKATLVIRVSTQTYQAMAGKAPLQESSYVLEEDANLADGDLECRCGSVGLLFSQQTTAEELDKLIQAWLQPLESKEPHATAI